MSTPVLVLLGRSGFARRPLGVGRVLASAAPLLRLDRAALRRFLFALVDDAVHTLAMS